MLIFGHTGITLGAAVLLNGAFAKSHPIEEGEVKESPSPSPSHQGRGITAQSRSPVGASWLISLADRIDVRLLLIGSLLPDILDKPIGHFFFKETFSNGRIFGHTLLFLILITLAGFYLYRSRARGWLLVLSFGTFTHLILDQMWLNPRTLLWPAYGFTFAKCDITNWIWIQNMLYALLTNPMVYIPELVGAAVFIWFAWIVICRKKVHAFIGKGSL
jgi:membrane-bound metal-dependent hydrolase YbcI (DUF457 family)